MATTTFLFVDQVGSTEQLTALGDSAAHAHRTELMAALREAVTRHGGDEVDAAGDGLFAAFTSATDAVAAAVTMQQSVDLLSRRSGTEHHELAVRIRAGLHAGEPLTNPDGSYFGTAVVVASRLCSRAQAGQVVVSDLVRSLVEPRGEHAFNAMGALDLKGVSSPVPASSLTWTPLDTVCPLPRELTSTDALGFAGRSRELQLMRAAFAQTAGGSGGRQLVLLTGELGAGTTRTAAEVARSAVRDGGVVWYGRARGSTAGADRLGPWVRALAQWTASASPPVQRWVGRSEVDLVGETQLTQAVLHLDLLLSRLSAAAPVVVVLDDLQDADDDTPTVLELLARSARPARLLLLACASTSTPGDERVVRALQGVAADHVRLQGLARAEVAELLAEVTGQEQPESTVGAVLAESDGLPGFVRRMGLAHRERAVIDEVGRVALITEDLRSDLVLRRGEIALGLRELDRLRGSAVAAADGPLDLDGTPPAEVPCPYRGLLPFSAQEAEDFAGREQLVAELVARLASSRFLAVVGPSGSGKSSAVHAGLLPALARGDLPGSQEWRCVSLVPGADPLGSLATALAAVSPSAGPDVVRTLLTSHPLPEVVATVCPGPAVLVVVDQAEELWTTGGGLDERFLDLVTAPADGIAVVMTLRADYYGRVAEHGHLAERVEDSQLLVRPLTDRELRAVVEVPARRAGLVLEPGLAQAVVDDVATAPGALPLVSAALLETWQRRRGRSLTLAGYAEAGGVRGAIAGLAEAAFQELDGADQALARRLLLRLAAPGADGDDVARRAPLGEVTADEPTRRVLAHLVDSRLVVTGAESAAVAHEALLREWPRLRTWLDADREGRRLHQQVAAATAEWDRDGRPADGLLRGARLAAAEEWAASHADDLSPAERDLLAASEELRDRELIAARRTARRFKALTGGLVAILVLALAAGGVALQQRSAAADRARVAEARGLASRAVALAPTQLDRALLLAVEGYRLDPSQQTADGLATALDAAGPLQSYVRDLPAAPADVAVTSDGATAYLVLDDAVVQYDTRTWKPSGPPLLEGLDRPGTLSVSGEDRWLLVGADDGVRRVDLRNGGVTGPFPAGTGDRPVGITSGDGSVFATTTFQDPVVRVYDHATGNEVATFDTGYLQPTLFPVPGAPGFLLGDVGGSADLRRIGADGADTGPVIAFPLAALELAEVSPGASRLLLASGTEAAIVELATGQVVGPAVSLPGSRAYSSDWNSDGTTVLVGTDTGSAQLVDAESGQAGIVLRGLSGGVLGRFTAGSSLLLAPLVGAPVVVDLGEVSPLATTLARTDGFYAAVATAGDGADALYVAVDGGLVRRSAQPGGAGALELVSRRDWLVQAVAVSPAGDRIAVRGLVAPSRDDARSAEVLKNELVAVLGDDGRVLWQQQLGQADSPVGAVAWSPDGSALANIGPTGVITVFDAGGQPRWPGVAVDYYAGGALVWSHDGSSVSGGGQSGVLTTLDGQTGAQLGSTPLSDVFQLSDAARLGESARFAVSSESGEVFLFDDSSPEPVGDRLSASGVQLQSVAASGSGDKIAAVARDGTLWVWDAASQRQVGPSLAGHTAEATGVAFLDEQTVVTTGFDGRLLRWDLAPEDWVRRACEIAGRELSEREWAEDVPDRAQAPTCPQAA